MRRRRLLGALGAGIGLLSGCLGSAPRREDSGGDGGDSDDGSDGTNNDDGSDDDGSTPELRSATLERAECQEPADASVAFYGANDCATITGCVIGETGCHAPALASAGYAGADPTTVRVVIASVDESDPDEMCTQALTDLGYLVRLTFAGGLPDRIEVVHDDAGGSETVATAEP